LNGLPDLWLSLATALGAGLLIGLERERRKRARAEEGIRSPAGIRTFTVTALSGAVAQALAQPLLVALGAVAVIALVLAAYRAGAGREADPGLTTELALLLTYLIGVLAIEQPGLAAAVSVVLAGLLAARERLHQFAVQWLREAELHDGLLLAALALVLLPLMPASPQPWMAGLVPRQLLSLLVLILVLQGAGHVAMRVMGPRAGLWWSGFASGFVSSTATIASLGTRARAAPPEERAAASAGALASTVATWVQATALMAALAPTVLPLWGPMALAGGAVALAASWVSLRGATAPAAGQPHAQAARADEERGPLRIREAALVAALLAAISLAIGWAQAKFGVIGMGFSTALAAVADAHAAVAALAALTAADRLSVPDLAAGACIALVANSVSRCVVAWTAGGAAFGRRVGLPLLLAAGAAAGTGALLGLWR
jgi:uncharacterized membrane protein (DUF4010 family)